MLSKDAIADVVEVLRGNDFYRPSHESIYEAILDLYGRGEPADAVTVADELTKRGEIAKTGGAAYLARSAGAFANAQSAVSAATAIADAVTAESYRFRWQTSDGASAFVGMSLEDLDGERVLGVTRTWLAPS